MLYDKVKLAAKEKGISINQLEKMAELPTGAICKWNVHCPSAVKLKTVADLLGTTADSLLE